MDYFPLFCRLQGKRCLLVGAGEVAERKARLLLESLVAATTSQQSVSQCGSNSPGNRVTACCCAHCRATGQRHYALHH
jgi:hypothetical protein